MEAPWSLKNTTAAEKNHNPVGGSTPSDGRGRVVKQVGMDLHYPLWCLGLFAMVMPPTAGQHHPHQPFLWSLIRLFDTTVVQQIVTPGAPSFKTDLCNLTTTLELCNNQSDFYLCPASNPGKSYCNSPAQYYCAYWGCETIATAWNPGGGKDKYLTVQFGPQGCSNRNTVEAVYHRGTGTVQKGNCAFLWVNVTNPMDPGWILGRTWGIRYYEKGADRGEIILIKKEEPPKTPRKVGPLSHLENKGTSRPTTTKLTPTRPGNNKMTSIPTPTPTAIGRNRDDSSLSRMWKIIEASYQLLNQTNPEITKKCWLCVSAQPPYYEAIGDMGALEYSNESNPSKCNWGQEIGITLTQVTGKGRCIGTVPRGKRDLCSITEDRKQPSNWLIPANNTRWVCSSLGVTPCLSLKLFNSSRDFCVQVVIIPRILYHSEEYIYMQHTIPQFNLKRREPVTAVTLATLMILGAAGAGTGIASLVKQSQEFTSLRVAVDEDLARIEQSITALEKSVRSLSEVVLQNRRGLDLIFLQQGGLCAALREECCVYADHTGVVRDTMTKLREGLEKRKREHEARQSWYESWFNYSPWLTTLLSTIAGPLLLLIFVLTFGPCIFNRVIAIVKSRLEAAHLMLIRAKYETVDQEEDTETLMMCKKALEEFNEQNK